MRINIVIKYECKLAYILKYDCMHRLICYFIYQITYIYIIICMYVHNIQNKYLYQQYNEIEHQIKRMSQIPNWLPPSLQPPTSKPIIPCLTITIMDISYLQILSTKPAFIKFKWWGLKSKKIQQPILQHSYNFLISVSLPMFVRYCMDMKILQFQLCDFANVCIVKGYINFLVYKHWGGELIEIVCDLKNMKNNAKIGEIKVSMEIKQIENPLLAKRRQQANNQSTVYRGGGGNNNDNNIDNISQIKNGNMNKKTVIQNNNRQAINRIQDINTLNIKNNHSNINANMNKRYFLNEQNNRNINNNNNEQQHNNYINHNNFIDYNIHQQQYRHNNRNKSHQDNTNNTHTNTNTRQRIEITSTKYKINQHDDTKTRLFKKLYLPLPDQCICDDIRLSSLNREKIQLQQQLDMILNEQSISTQSDDINIQVIGWQALNKSDTNMPCKVIVPVLDREGRLCRNQYYFGTGTGVIKIKVDRTNKQDILKDYLTNNCIDIYVGDNYVGKLPLFKIVGSRGEVVSTSVCDVRGKKEVLKGHCMMKLVHSTTTNNKQNNTNINTAKQKHKKQHLNDIQQNKQQIQANNQTSVQVQQPNYLWIYLRQLNFLQPRHHTDSNTYISLPQQTYKSKTLWRSNCPTYNEILTVKLPIKQLVLQVWNKQATERLIGRAYLDTSARMDYNADVPVEDGYGRVVGYLGLCMGKGDLATATQFINTHAGRFYDRSHGQSREPSRYDPGTHRNKQSQQHSHQHQHQPQNSNQHQQHSKQQPQKQDSISHEQQPSPSPSPQQTNNFTISPRIPRPQQSDLNILQLHNKIFTNYTSKNYDWFTTYTNKQLSIAQLSHLLKPICQKNNTIKFISLYLDAQSNTIDLQHIRQSYQAFEVYYDILVQDRDRVLGRVLEQLGEDGVSINQVEDGVRGKLRKSKKVEEDMWRAFKEYIDELTVQNLSYFYEGATVEQVCDALRRFQVYQSTRGEEIPTQLLSAQVLREICDVLDIDPHLNTSDIKSAIDQAGLELSKYELLALFGQIPKKINPSKARPQSQMIKSPTFGLLGTERVMQQQQQQQQKNLVIDNPSIDARTFQNKSGFSGLSGLQQKFGRPNISPINQNAQKNAVTTIRFSNFDHAIEMIVINDKQFGLEGLCPDDSIELEIPKQFNYEGYILTTDDIKIEFDGPVGEWIGLMDQMGEYCGNLVFQ